MRRLVLAIFLLGSGLRAQQTTLADWAAALKRGAELDRAGQLQDAEQAYQQAIEIAESMKVPARVGSSYNNLGVFYFRRERFADGERAFRKGIEAFQKSDTPASDDALAARSNLANLLIAAGKHGAAREQAEALLRAAEYHPRDPRAAKALLLIAQAEQGRGDSSRSLWNYRFAIERLEHKLPETQAELDSAAEWALGYLATVLEKLKPESELLIDVEFLDPAAWLLARYGDAELGRALATRARAVYAQRFGVDNPAWIESACDLAAAYRRLGRFAEAEAQLEDALAVLRGGAWDETMGIPVLWERADLHAAQGDEDKVGEALDELIAVHRRAFKSAPAYVWRTVEDAEKRARRLGLSAVADRLRALREAMAPPPWILAGLNATQVQSVKVDNSRPPSYPSHARARGLEATVFVLAIIDEQGKVQAAHTLEGFGHGFDEATKAAVRKWRYEPATAVGKAYPWVKLVQINFHLRR